MNALDYVNHQRLLNEIGKAIDTNVVMCTTVDEMEYFAKTILDSYVYKGVIQSYQLNYDAQDGKLDVMITPIKAVEKVDVWFAPAGLQKGAVKSEWPYPYDADDLADPHISYVELDDAEESICEDKAEMNTPFNPVLLPIIRNVMPNLIAQQIIGVQPMSDYLDTAEEYNEMPQALATTLGL